MRPRWRHTRRALALGLLAASAHGGNGTLPDIVVTATREPAPVLTLVGNTARVDEERIAIIGATHAGQLGSQVAGTWLARGSEQESLPSIRSPVLTGPGSCGAFLVLEDGIPVRPAGFCNVNELFEVLTDESTAMEVVRGPSNALYGANGLHGTINFLLPEPGAQSGLAASGEAGPHHYWRTRLQWDGEAGADPLVAGVTLDHDGDFRADAGYEQAKGFLKLRHDTGAGPLEVGFAATVLDQETAGYISQSKDSFDAGYRIYEDAVARRQNANPEAFRDADSQRLYVRFTPEAGHAFAGADLRAFLRRSHMDFLQHFLPGKPREENGQWSGGFMATSQRELAGGRELTAGFDLEYASGWLEEFQAKDVGIPAIPPGWHYDYDAQSVLAAPYAQIALPLSPAWSLQLGLRAEYMRYSYDNHMLDGNTRDDGTPCDPAPCRFSRPGDRDDDFLNVAPSAGLLWRISPELAAWFRLARGFRPPQATELYRLQAQQQVADLDSETLDSAELGLHWVTPAVRTEIAAFAMKKRNFIFQDAARFNVNDGRTRHLGVELQADLLLPANLYAGFAGTYARQTYAFSARTPGGDDIVTGNDIDTAPRTLASAHVGATISRGRAEVEWVHVGRHHLDAGNLSSYGGHNLLNLRAAWRVTPGWQLTLRLNNLTDELYAERADYVTFPAPAYRYFPGRDRELYVELAWGAF